MMFRSLTVQRLPAVVSVTACLVAALLSVTGPRAAAVPLTADDPFYSAPVGYEAAAPGTILRSRQVQVSTLRLLPTHIQAWQLLYRTTDSHGAPYIAASTVMVPDGPPRPRPLLSYQTAVDAVADMCRPSVALQQGVPIDFTNPNGPIGIAAPSVEILLAASGLERGWAVTIPDQGGTDDHFLTPEEPGYVVLDGIRAAEQFGPLGLAGVDTPVGLYGYSGGGVASTWAAEMAPHYAPELKLVGAVLGAPVADLAGTLISISNTPTGGLLPLAGAAMSKDSAEFADTLSHYLTPAARQLIDRAKRQCTGQIVIDADLDSIGRFLALPDFARYITVPVDVFLADPVVARMIEQRSYTKHTPTAPVYEFNGVYDEASTIAGADAQTSAYCSRGVSVTYRRDSFPILAHGPVAVLGAPDAFNWLQRRMDGEPALAGCDIQTVPSTLLNPGALDTLGAALGTAIRTLLGFAPGSGR
ncbi:lipase family protein [Nocardia sp. NPDC006044]|uniref:lipase family protein n=1 Tax=Nocardia sp. NPDC006044 TaxID=3364306 RepID=UPI00369A7A37